MLPKKNSNKNKIQPSLMSNLFDLIGLKIYANEEDDIISLTGVL
jgi:hypothetical protein